MRKETRYLNVLFQSQTHWHYNRCDKLFNRATEAPTFCSALSPEIRSCRARESLPRSHMRRNAKSVPAMQDLLRWSYGTVQHRRVTLSLSLLPASKRGHVTLRLSLLPASKRWHATLEHSLLPALQRRHDSTSRCKIRSWLKLSDTSIFCSTSCGKSTSTFCSQIFSEIYFCGFKLTILTFASKIWSTGTSTICSTIRSEMRSFTSELLHQSHPRDKYTGDLLHCSLQASDKAWQLGVLRRPDRSTNCSSIRCCTRSCNIKRVTSTISPNNWGTVPSTITSKLAVSTFSVISSNSGTAAKSATNCLETCGTVTSTLCSHILLAICTWKFEFVSLWEIHVSACEPGLCIRSPPRQQVLLGLELQLASTRRPVTLGLSLQPASPHWHVALDLSFLLTSDRRHATLELGLLPVSTRRRGILRLLSEPSWPTLIAGAWGPTSLQPWSHSLHCRSFHADFSLAATFYLDSPSQPFLRNFAALAHQREARQYVQRLLRKTFSRDRTAPSNADTQSSNSRRHATLRLGLLSASMRRHWSSSEPFRPTQIPSSQENSLQHQCLRCRTFHAAYSLSATFHLRSPSPPSLWQFWGTGMSTKSSPIRSCEADFNTLSWMKTPSSTCLSGTSKSRVCSLNTLQKLFLREHLADELLHQSQELECWRSARQSVAGFCLRHHLRFHWTALSSAAREHREFDPREIRCSAQHKADESCPGRAKWRSWSVPWKMCGAKRSQWLTETSLRTTRLMRSGSTTCCPPGWKAKLQMSCSISQEPAGNGGGNEPTWDIHPETLAIAVVDSRRSWIEQSMIHSTRGPYVKRNCYRSPDNNFDQSGAKTHAYASTAQRFPLEHVSGAQRQEIESFCLAFMFARVTDDAPMQVYGGTGKSSSGNGMHEHSSGKVKCKDSLERARVSQLQESEWQHNEHRKVGVFRWCGARGHIVSDSWFQ